MMIPGACAEATSGLSSDAPDAAVDGGATADGATSFDAAHQVPNDATAPEAKFLLINEVASDKEWVELVNASSVALDISGLGIADQLPDAGVPKLSEALRFPSGTILSPHAYVVVHNPSGDASACPVGSESYCFKMSFGISTKNGETLYVLGADDKPLSSVAVPPNAAPAGSTWARIGNADPGGVFKVTPPTPGAANVEAK